LSVVVELEDEEVEGTVELCVEVWVVPVVCCVVMGLAWTMKFTMSVVAFPGGLGFTKVAKTENSPVMKTLENVKFPRASVST